MENKRLLRSNNRMLAGVCAGIAEYFGWEVSTVRIVYALATIFTAFSGGIIYLILWIVMPERWSNIRCKRTKRSYSSNTS